MDSLFFIGFNGKNNEFNFIDWLLSGNYNYFFFYLLILILMVYPLIVKYHLLYTLKKQINDIYLFFQKNEIDYYFLDEHFFSNILYFNYKPNRIRLTFRLFEVNKEVKEKYEHRKIYIWWQYIDFFYIEIILDYFYSLILRLLYFFIVFICKLWKDIFNLIIYIVFFNSKLYYIIYYNIISLTIKIVNLGKHFFLKIYSFFNYIKLEWFIYVTNDNNFYGGFLLYIYNGIYHKMSIFNNIKLWKTNKLPHFDIVNNFFSKWKNMTKYIYLLEFSKYIKLTYYIFSMINICLSYILFTLRLRFINLTKIFNFISLFKFFNINLNYIFIGLGGIFFFFYDTFKNIIIIFFVFIKKIIIRLKYIIIFFLFYKFGLIYIFYVSCIYFLNDHLANYLDAILFQSLTIIYDFNDIILCKNLELDNDILAAWAYKYKELLIKKQMYQNNTIIGQLSLFSLRNFNFANLNLKSAYDLTEIYRSSPLRYTWRKYFHNIFHVVSMEIKDYLTLKYYFFLYNNIKIYNIFLLFINDESIIYYLLKKLYLIAYIIEIYLLMYLKYLYFYIVPYYFLTEIILKWYSSYNKIWFILLFLYYIITNIYIIIWNILLIIGTHIYIYLIIFILFIKEILNCLYINILMIYLIVKYVINNIFRDIANYITMHIFINYYETYIAIYVYKYYIISKFKEISINYLRLNIDNLIYFKYNQNVITGNKVIAHTQFNLDELDLGKVRESGGIGKTQLDESLIQDILRRRFEDLFSYRHRLYIYNNLYFIISYFYNYEDSWNNIFFEDLWIINYYIKNIIFYFFLDIYILFYIIFFFILKKIFNLNNFKPYNVDYLWSSFRKNFSFKELNNYSYYLRGIYFYQKMHNKKTLANKMFKFMDSQWTSIKKFKKIKNKSLDILSNLGLGLKKKYLINRFNHKLKNFIIEKNMYYNNFKYFYWKNLVLFDKIDYRNDSFIGKYENGKAYNILNFLLSLTFKKSIYCVPIFFYFQNSNKYFYWNNNYNRFFYMTNYIVTNYFNRIETWLNLYKNDDLLNKDSSLVLFKDEDEQISDMYSLNFNTIIPKYEYDFFWLAFILYILILKLKCRNVHYTDLFSMFMRLTYFKMILINNNFMFLYDIGVYWFNYCFMFDVKNMGYEQHDFKHHLSKTKRYYKLVRPSSLFLINNDPLYLLKKSYSYHLTLDCKINYSVLWSTSFILYLTYIKYWLNFIIFIAFYKKLSIDYNNNSLDLYNFIHIYYVYRKNIIKYYNYLILKLNSK